MIGKTVSHYKILEKLGEGTLGALYKAQDVNLDRLVVLKFLRPGLGLDETAKARFVQEAKAASTLDHRNICTFYGMEQAESGQWFIAMAHYEGETLKEKLKRGPLPLKEAGSIAGQIAEGLSEVHKKGIVHRNLKPENIFVTAEGVPKILDFGFAKLRTSAALTRVGSAVGSPAYMSPEQLRGEQVDNRTDIWALGVIAYLMITGRRPFEGDRAESLVQAMAQSDPPPMSQFRATVPPEWESIVHKALAKNAYDRYQQIDDLLADAKATLPTPRTASLSLPVAAPGAAPVTETASVPKVGMAYVLFTDIVGYSTLLMHKQAEISKELTRVVQSTEQFVRSKKADQLILLPTGDGMAMVFFDDPMAPIECAVEISRTLKTHPALGLRMGVHTGPVYRTRDINQARNVAGSGINLAQRIMDCGDAGHILISKSYADFLEQLGGWRDYIHELGVTEVKHGVPVHLFNLYGDEFGNPERPVKFRPAKAEREDREPGTAPSSAGPQAELPRFEPPPYVPLRHGRGNNWILAAGFVAAAAIGVLAWTGILNWRSVYCRLMPSSAACVVASGTDVPAKHTAQDGLKNDALERAEDDLAAGDLKAAQREISMAKEVAPSDPNVQRLDELIQRRVRVEQRKNYLAIGAGLIAVLALVLFLAMRRGGQPAFLEVIAGPQGGMTFPLSQDVIRLGAATGDGGLQNDVVLADKDQMISRFHCEIRRHRNSYFLVDLSSANGTFLDGRRLEPGKPVRVKPGSKIELARKCTIRLGSTGNHA